MADAAEHIQQVDDQIDQVEEDAEAGTITEEQAQEQLDTLEAQKEEAVEEMTDTASHEVSMDDVTAAVEEQSNLNKEQSEAINKLSSDMAQIETSLEAVSKDLATQKEQTNKLMDAFHTLEESQSNTIKDEVAVSAQKTRSEIQQQILDEQGKISVMQESIQILEAKVDELYEPATCHDLFDCESCIARDACGWCPSTGLCLEGSAAGCGSEESCPDFSYDECVGHTCINSKTCAECMMDEQCGWCQTTEECQYSTDFGNKDGCADFYHPTS